MSAKVCAPVEENENTAKNCLSSEYSRIHSVLPIIRLTKFKIIKHISNILYIIYISNIK